MTNTPKTPTVGVQTYIPATTVTELDTFVAADKEAGDRQASRNKLINEAVAEYLERRKAAANG